MRIRDRDLLREFDLRINGDIVGEFVTRNKVFEGINWRSSTPAEVRDQFDPATLERIALGQQPLADVSKITEGDLDG
jgi:hypothetical protein